MNAPARSPVARVAHITTVPLSLEALLLDQLSYLQRAGYEIVGVSSPGPEAAAIQAAGIRHMAVPISRSMAPLTDVVSLVRLYELMRRERFDIVHTHTPKAGLLGQLAARLAGVPVIINTLHGFYFHEHMSPWSRRFFISLEKVAGRCSDLILSQNAEDLRTAVRERICPADRITYLGNGIDLGRFDPERVGEEEIARKRRELGIAPGAPVIGFVGRLAGRRKGFRDFLAAAGQVATKVPDVRFVIAGQADLGKSDAVEPAVAARYDVAGRCLFLGYQPNERLPLLYRLMDVLVLPSLFEGVPRVVMEATAMGVPAVVTAVKGNREAVEHGRNGLLVPLGDVAALAHAITHLLQEPALREAMGKEGRRMAVERFDQQVVFRHVEREYARLLSAKGIARAATPAVETAPEACAHV